MKHKRLSNLFLKIAALFFAVLLWLYVANTVNPWREKSISVPITILNQDVFTKNNKTFSIASGISSVVVRATVRSEDYSSLTADDFTATIDCNLINDLNGAVRVNVSYKGNILVSDWTQVTETVQILTEDIESHSYPITVKTTGETAPGYWVGSTVCDPVSVTVNAPKSTLVEINSAAVVVDVTGSSESFESDDLQILFYDVLGNTLILDDEDVTFSVERASASVSILKMNEVPIDFSGVTGIDQIAEGSRYNGLTASMSSVQLKGPQDILDTLSSLVIPSEMLNLAGASETFSINIDLTQYLPAGLSIDGDSVVMVTFEIVPVETKDLTFVTGRIKWTGKTSDYVYTVTSQTGTTIPIVISGYEGELDDVVASDLWLCLDVSGLEEGTYEIPVTLEKADGVPDGVELSSPLTMTVEIEAASPEPETHPEEAATETEEESTPAQDETETDPESSAAGEQENQ